MCTTTCLALFFVTLTTPVKRSLPTYGRIVASLSLASQMLPTSEKMRKAMDNASAVQPSLISMVMDLHWSIVGWIDRDHLPRLPPSKAWCSIGTLTGGWLSGRWNCSTPARSYTEKTNQKTKTINYIRTCVNYKLFKVWSFCIKHTFCF